jgi:hypothetical protein
MTKSSFFEKKNVRLDEFPSLFQMEGHTGGFGVFFALAWFVLIYFFIPNIMVPQLFALAVAIGSAFVALVWASFWLGDRFAQQIHALDKIRVEDRAVRKKKLEKQVRYGIAILSGLYVVVCCVLIWITGGLLSPFTGFYIMVFTLTLEKCDVPNPGVFVLLYFGIMISLAFTVFRYSPPPITNNDMADILQSDAQKGMQVFFVLASLAIPTISKYFVKKKKKARNEAAKGA